MDVACHTDYLETHTVATRLSLKTLLPHFTSEEFRDRSPQRGGTSESLRVDAPGSSHMSSHSGELRILSVYGKGEGPLAVDGHDTLFTASEVEALNSLSADHSVAKSLERGERLVCREELSVQQTPDTISIKVEEDIGGGMPAIEDNDIRDCSTQRGATSESLRVDAPGSSHMSGHSGELRILSVYGQGEGPLAVDGHDTLFAASELEALSSLSADHSVAKSLNCSVRLVRLEELTGHQGGRKGRPGVLCGKVVPNNANMIVHMRTHSGEKPYKCDQCTKRFSLKGTLNRHMMNHFGKITRKSAAAHRHYLLCPVCLRTQESLSCHLRRVCMKDKTPPQILEVVEKAKKDVCDLLKNGRAFSYAVLKQIVSSPNPLEGLIEELKYHHLFVTGVPPPLPIGNPRLVTETLSECPGEAPGETEPSDVESCGSNELFQCRQEKTYTKDKMVKAKDLGILKKHSADHPLLKRFADYLKNDYENAKYQQEVDTVSRYLYFADPTEPSLKFVNDREKLRDFLGQQAKAGYKAQTSGNYIKCLKRFLEFHLTRTGLRQDDGELYKQCTLYLSFLTSSQSVLSKQASKEIVQKSHALSFDKSQPTPRECLAVLDKGEGDLVKIMNQLDDSSSSSLSRTECIFVLYYLEAIVILRHCQQPCVVQSMKVKEWLERKTRR
uniref:Uncharacterized protein n=2 Tax=Gadus morhua TaxID=8049 RepID=A0A8C5AY97_GADMO